MDYRKIWFDKFPESNIKWIVHHINSDRKENNIMNLILIPKEMHAFYHYLNSIIKNDISTGFEFYNVIDWWSFKQRKINKVFEKFFTVSNEILEFIEMRDLYLLQGVKRGIYWKKHDRK